MAKVVQSKKAGSQNPLKSSTPLGAALAYLGIEGAVPLFHGSQGCTSFALVLAVRHFKEAIPLQTTAMNEAATVLGGADNIQEALLNISNRMQPRFIGVASTALVETRGEDFVGELALIRKRCRELDDVAIAFASTPDFDGALEEGWSKATTAVVRELVSVEAGEREAMRVNLLPGVHQTPADVDELRDLCERFGLSVTVLPDVSGSLDGHVPDDYVGTSLGGTPLSAVRAMGRAAHTIAIGAHMRGPAEALHERTGVKFTVLPSATGLAESDALLALLMQVSGRDAPAALKRQRSQLVDALLDAHFWFGGRRIALAADPDLLLSLSKLVTGLGAQITAAVTTVGGSAALSDVPCDEVLVGDLSDLERMAAEGPRPDLLMTHSHGRMASETLGVPLYRVGFPIFDRLGAQHRCSVGYRGTRELVYALANQFISQHHEARPEDFQHEPAPDVPAATQEVAHVHA